VELSIHEFLIDTNILIDYLADTLPSPGINIIKEIIEKTLNISVITQIEYLGWHNHIRQSKKAAEEIVNNASIFHLTSYIITDTILLKQQRQYKTFSSILLYLQLL